ncbi:hypothetical protein PRK78_001745 [Emydomyces testavorans]|uniref:Wings apart-like protein C-terminal domain-containing protein n=1 Tax=Emydomyces testavorans TaxID=2070801 RepID=A0AAF0DF39_9EURO|nr:hypothetical protein PRK78_001745 [Emydomyces testavorans]
MENFSSSRKLKTYGRVSRNIGYSPLQQTAPERADRTVSPGKKDTKIAGKSRAYGDPDVQSSSAMGKLDAAEGHKSVRRPQAAEFDGSIYDILSSDDELQIMKQNKRKRRKLETSKVPWKSREADSGVSKWSGGPQRAQVGKALERQKSPVKKTVQPCANKASQVEVVIRTPPSVKAKRITNLHHDHGLQIARTSLPSRVSRKQSLSARSSTKLFQYDASSLLSRPNPTASTPTKQTSRPCPSRTPSQKLKEMTQHLSTESYFSRPRKRPLESETEPSMIFSAETPGTASRMRLIDALNTREPASADDSSDSDVTLRSDGLYLSRTNSQNSSNAPAMIDSQSTNTFLSTSSRPQRPPISSQLQQNSLRVTYARQRSFRTESDMDVNLTGLNDTKSTSAPQNDPLLLDVGTSLLPPKSVPNLKDLEGDNDTGPGTVRSIYELRRAGSNARYQAIIESIFEDLEDTTASVSRKRSGFVQLCSKLIDPEFARRFVSNSIEKRLSVCTTNEPDVICKYIAVCIYTLLLTLAPTFPVASQTCFIQILEAAPSLIPEERDIMELSKLRSVSMSKAGQFSLQDLSAQLRESKIWSASPPRKLSPRNMALRALELAVRRVREAGDQTTTISSSVLTQVVELLLQHSLESAKGDLFVLEITFSILESYTVGLPSLDDEQENVLKRLSRLGILLAELVERSDARSGQIQILQIRLILNITNNNPSLCEDFATPDLVGTLARFVSSNFETVADDLASDKRESLLDTVILALGTLINLTEWSSTSRRLFLQMRHGSAVLVDSLVGLFVGGLETISEADSVVQTHSNVAFGYLSVLLSTLCLDDDVRSHVRGQLRGNNLGRLLVIMDEFLHYYRKVEEELKDSALEEDAMSGFTSRLQSIVDRIREAEGLRK